MASLLGGGRGFTLRRIMAISPPPGALPREQGSGRGVIIVLLVVLIVAVLGVGFMLVQNREAASSVTTSSPSEAPSPTRTSTSAPKPTKVGSPPQVTETFSSQKWAKGEKLWL